MFDEAPSAHAAPEAAEQRTESPSASLHQLEAAPPVDAAPGAPARILESIRLIAAHYGLWFAEAVHQFGLEGALQAERAAGDAAVGLALSRLGGGANPFEGWAPESLHQMEESLSKFWLGMDGVWFQAVEGLAGMDGAKRVNDTCWARFAPLEAVRIKSLLGIPPGADPLDALEACLRQRFNSRVNSVLMEREPGALVLRVTSCRVQAARRRKHLPDYPCRSAGVTEYEGFARAVDPRIRTRCLACPPDPLPEGEYCSWRFSLD